MLGDGPVVINAGRPVTTMTVTNTGDRPVQVGSHYHFAEANPALEFDRRGGVGAAAGRARRHRGALRAGHRARGRPRAAGRRPGRAGPARRGRRPALMDRARYALLYGPTAGDRIRLADTDLLIEIEEDRSAGGDEAVFGGGKVIRESMGQSRATRAEGAADTVITGAVVLDHWGVVKADVGIRDGRIVALGKAGNPDTMDGVAPGAGDRPVHRDHLGQRPHPHRRRHRLPRPPHLPADPGGGAGRRHHHRHRRRHRAGGGLEGDDRHPRRLAPGPHARGARPVAGQRRAARQGQHHVRRGHVGAAAGRRLRVQAARGLGLDAGGHRRLPAGRGGVRASRSPSTATP